MSQSASGGRSPVTAPRPTRSDSGHEVPLLRAPGYGKDIGADFRDASFGGADLTGARFLTQDQLGAAKGDATTTLPPALTRPAHWTP